MPWGTCATCLWAELLHKCTNLWVAAVPRSSSTCGFSPVRHRVHPLVVVNALRVHAKLAPALVHDECRRCHKPVPGCFRPRLPAFTPLKEHVATPHIWDAHCCDLAHNPLGGFHLIQRPTIFLARAGDVACAHARACKRLSVCVRVCGARACVRARACIVRVRTRVHVYREALVCKG